MPTSEARKFIEYPVKAGLGRRPYFDQRNLDFPLRAATTITASKRKIRNWATYKILDQAAETCLFYPFGNHQYCGEQGYCTGFGAYSLLRNAPIRNRYVPSPLDIYHGGQFYDQWSGEDYAGGSTLGVLKFLQKQTRTIDSYYWTTQAEEAFEYVMEHGPILIGINWYSGMFDPIDNEGTVRISGYLAGGHLLCVSGANREKGTVRFPNSWGKSWGNQGFGQMTIETLQRLLNEEGECANVVETRT